MELLIALLFAMAFAFGCRNVLKDHPAPFYMVAAVVAVGFAWASLSGELPLVARAVFPYLQRGLLAFALFAIVMFVGVFPEGSKARAWLAPVRGELSIIAALLAMGHVLRYVAIYGASAFSGISSMPVTMLLSFWVALVLVLMLALLAITSFRFVRKRMDSQSWKRLQLLAYPFFLLIYVHLVLVLGPSAMASGRARLSIVLYTVLFATYAALRIVRAVDNHNHVLAVQPV